MTMYQHATATVRDAEWERTIDDGVRQFRERRAQYALKTRPTGKPLNDLTDAEWGLTVLRMEHELGLPMNEDSGAVLTRLREINAAIAAHEAAGRGGPVPMRSIGEPVPKAPAGARPAGRPRTDAAPTTAPAATRKIERAAVRERWADFASTGDWQGLARVKATDAARYKQLRASQHLEVSPVAGERWADFTADQVDRIRRTEPQRYKSLLATRDALGTLRAPDAKKGCACE